jgi:hypothetical protein
MVEAESEFLFHLGGEADRFDFPAEIGVGFFGELDTEAGGVNAAAFDFGQPEEGVELVFDFDEGNVLEFDANAIVDDFADALAEIEDEETGDEFIEGFELEVEVLAGVEDFLREESAIGVGGDAAIFQEPLFFVNALGADAGEEGLAGLVSTDMFVDALDEALGDGFLDGDGMEAPTHGIAVSGDSVDEFIKGGGIPRYPQGDSTSSHLQSPRFSLDVV